VRYEPNCNACIVCCRISMREPARLSMCCLGQQIHAIIPSGHRIIRLLLKSLVSWCSAHRRRLGAGRRSCTERLEKVGVGQVASANQLGHPAWCRRSIMLALRSRTKSAFPLQLTPPAPIGQLALLPSLEPPRYLLYLYPTFRTPFRQRRLA